MVTTPLKGSSFSNNLTRFFFQVVRMGNIFTTKMFWEEIVMTKYLKCSKWDAINILCIGDKSSQVVPNLGKGKLACSWCFLFFKMFACHPAEPSAHLTPASFLSQQHASIQWEWEKIWDKGSYPVALASFDIDLCYYSFWHMVPCD